MEEWLRKLMSAIGGQVKPTPPFVQSPNGVPAAPLGGATPPVYQQPVQPQPQVTQSVPATNTPSVPLGGTPTPTVPSTPEQQYANKLGEYNALQAQDPKLKHNFKNNLLQGLFIGLQGLQRIADPQNAPQEPVKYLGQARKDYKLNQMTPMLQGLNAQVGARAAARKEDLATQNVQSEIKARDTETTIKQYNQTHPGMETIKDEDGNILERPKGSSQPYKIAGGVTPVKKIPITLSDGRSVDVPTIEAVKLDVAKTERETERLFQQGKINADQADQRRKELDDWRQKEETRTQQLVTWTNDALAKDQEAKSLRDQAKGIAGTKEALDLETKAATLEAERDRLFNQAKTSSPNPKPTTPTPFVAPAGTVPGKKAKKANDPYNLLN